MGVLAVAVLTCGCCDKKHLAELEQANNDMAVQITSLRTDLDKKLDKMRADITKLQRQTSDYKTKAADIEQQMSDDKTKVADLQEALEKSKQEAASKKAESIKSDTRNVPGKKAGGKKKK